MDCFTDSMLSLRQVKPTPTPPYIQFSKKNIFTKLRLQALPSHESRARIYFQSAAGLRENERCFQGYPTSSIKRHHVPYVSICGVHLATLGFMSVKAPAVLAFRRGSAQFHVSQVQACTQDQTWSACCAVAVDTLSEHPTATRPLCFGECTFRNTAPFQIAVHQWVRGAMCCKQGFAGGCDFLLQWYDVSSQ